MSITSRARDRAKNGKRKSPESGRPRLYGEISKSKPVPLAPYLVQYRDRPKTRGAFGGVTRLVRKAREQLKGGSK